MVYTIIYYLVEKNKGEGIIMEIRNCVRCKRVFQYMGGPPICKACKEKEEELFKVVKEYIYEHKEANMVEVSNETGVSTKIIEKFIRDGRLMISQDSPIFLKCEKCGAEIKTGRFCDACSRSLSNEIRISTRSAEITKEDNSFEKIGKDRMHFLSKAKLEK